MYSSSPTQPQRTGDWASIVDDGGGGRDSLQVSGVDEGLPDGQRLRARGDDVVDEKPPNHVASGAAGRESPKTIPNVLEEENVVGD